MKIDVNSLSPQWIIGARGTSRDISLPQRYGEGVPLKLAVMDDILYLPHMFNGCESICMTRDGIVPNESIGDWHLDYVRSRCVKSETLYKDEFEADYSSLNVCIIGNVYSKVFWHWTEEMIKVVILEHNGFDGYYVVCDMPRFCHDFLSLAGISSDRILDIRRPVVFKSAVFSTHVNHENIDRHPNVLRLLREVLFTRIDPVPSPYGEKIWMERGAMVAKDRFLLNHDEVYAVLARYGVVGVDMATLSVAEQLRVARDMRLAGGVHGSQFAHVQFMPFRSAVIECFSPCYINPCVIEICRTLAHCYYQMVPINTGFAPYSHGRDTIVNCSHLDLVLRNLVS
ncbi:MAG: glycosyltransferase family 61 protein [Stellaceae bacterium]